MKSLFQLLGALAIISFVAATSLEAQAKVRVAIWDFENNSARSWWVIVYRSGLTKGTGVLSGARRIDVTMSITRIPL